MHEPDYVGYGTRMESACCLTNQKGKLQNYCSEAPGLETVAHGRRHTVHKQTRSSFAKDDLHAQCLMVHVVSHIAFIMARKQNRIVES